MSKKFKIIISVAAFIFLLRFGPTLFLYAQVLYLNLVQTTHFEVKGDIVYMNGEINSKTYNQFIQLHKENPQITTVYEQIVPGSVDDDTMIKLSYYIREQGFNTMLGCNSAIDSGGVDLFLAGVERFIDCGDPLIVPHIGVHSWGDSNKSAHEFPKDSPEHEQNRKYIEDMLGSDEFYWFTIYAAPAESIHEMTREEINHYNLVTQW